MSRRRLINPPRLRSEHGFEAGRRVTWLEVFFDLVFVAAVAQVGTHLGDDYTLAGLGRFSLLFVLVWWAWLGHTTFSTRFDTDDVVQRGLTALQLFLVAVMAVNARGTLDGRDAAGFVAAYAVMRLVLTGQFAHARRVRRARALTTLYAFSCGTAAALWLASAFIDAPGRFWLWAVALSIDVGTPIVATRYFVDAPHDAAHLPERYGLFSIILIGESMAAVMAGMAHQEYWSVRAATAAMTGMALVFATCWWYFDGAGATEPRSIRSRADAVRFHVWSYAHLPLYLGIAVAGVGLERIITTATEAPLPGEEAAILAGASLTVAVSMIAIGAVRQPAKDPTL